MTFVESTEFTLTARDFAAISAMLMQEAGITLNAAKTNLVYSRLAKRLRLLGLKNFHDYCALVAAPSGLAERQAMVAALTTNVTRFFREPHHFEHLKTQILPGLVTRARRGERIRLWSAGCSSGQEPYSIALTLLSMLPDAARHDIRILATDIDQNMLSSGAAGRYELAQLAGISPALRARWFSRDQDGLFQIAPEALALVRFRKMNLLGAWPMRGTFQVIFCRNVVIYFKNAAQDALWSRLLPILDEDGVLYIGHSERVSGPAELSFRSDGITIYRPVEVV